MPRRASQLSRPYHFCSGGLRELRGNSAQVLRRVHTDYAQMLHSSVLDEELKPAVGSLHSSWILKVTLLPMVPEDNSLALVSILQVSI